MSRFQKLLRTIRFMVEPWHPPKRPAFFADADELEPRYLPKSKPPIERKTPESPFLQRLRQAAQDDLIGSDYHGPIG